MRGRKAKFLVGDRVVGKESAPASFRGRIGTVVERGPGKSEYGIKFDDTGQVEHVESSWLDRLGSQAGPSPGG